MISILTSVMAPENVAFTHKLSHGQDTTRKCEETLLEGPFFITEISSDIRSRQSGERDLERRYTGEIKSLSRHESQVDGSIDFFLRKLLRNTGGGIDMDGASDGRNGHSETDPGFWLFFHIKWLN